MKRKHLQGYYCLLQGTLWGAYGFLFSYANRYLLDTGLISTQIGIILGIATGLSFLLQPLLTAVVDKTRLSCKAVLMGSALVMTLCCFLLPVIRVRWAVVLLYAGACVTLQVLPSFSNALGMAAIHQGNRLNFGIARGIGSVSFGICAQLAVPAIEHFGLDTVPLLGGVMGALLILSALPFSNGQGNREETPDPTPLVEFFRRNGKFALFLVGSVLLYVGHNVLSNCMFQIAEFKGDGNAQGTALLIAAVVELPTMFLFARMCKWMNCGKWVCLSGIFFTLRLLLTWLLPGVGGLYAAQITQMLGFALFAVSSVYYVDSVVDKRDVVKGQTYLGVSNTLGCLIAHFLGGALIDLFGVSRMLLCCVAVSAVGMILLFVSVERKKLAQA